MILLEVSLHRRDRLVRLLNFGRRVAPVVECFDFRLDAGDGRLGNPQRVVLLLLAVLLMNDLVSLVLDLLLQLIKQIFPTLTAHIVVERPLL